MMVKTKKRTTKKGSSSGGRGGGGGNSGRVQAWQAPTWSKSSPNNDDNDDDGRSGTMFSDWQIKVVLQSNHSNTTKDGNTNDTITNTKTAIVTYNVHKFAIGLQSKYFKGLFEQQHDDDDDDIDNDDGNGNDNDHNNGNETCNGDTVQPATTTRTTTTTTAPPTTIARRVGTTMLELPGPTISLEHFETMLEYCYTGHIAFHEGNAIAMLYFGETLQIRALKEDAITSLVQSIREFTKHPHNSDTEKSELLAAYYLEAKCLSRSSTTSSSSSTFQEQEQAKTKASSTTTVMQELRTAIVDRCAGQPRWVAKNTALFTMHDPKFWWKVWKARKKYKKEAVAATTLWSTNLAYFLQATTTTTNQHPHSQPEHPTIIDRDFFAFLTHIDSLPVVSTEASVMLMDYEQQLLALYDDDGKRMMHGNNNNNNNNNATELTCLQKRCTKALYNQKTRDWEVTNDTRLLLEGHLRNLPPVLLEALLLRAMEPAAGTTTTTTTINNDNDNNSNNNNNNNNNSDDGDTRVPFTTSSSTTKVIKSAAVSFVEEINNEIEVVSRRKNNNNTYDAGFDNNTRGPSYWISSKHTTKQTKTKTKKKSSFVSSKSRRDGKKNIVETVNGETTNIDENNNSHIANTTVSTNIGGSSSSKNNGGDAEKSKITASVSFLGDISIIDFDIDTENMITSIPNYLPPPTSTRSNGTTTAVYSFMNEID